MITNERIVAFMNSLEGPGDRILEEIEEKAHKDNVPIIRKEMESFLRVLIEIKKPRRVLEIGTAVGYSALIMNQVMPRDGKIVTIENYEKRILAAKENFRRAKVEDKIELIEGDASSELKKINGLFDFVFIDAAKGQYGVYLKEVIRLIDKGGIIICDNIFQEGDLINSRYAVERRNRTIHKRMRQFLLDLKRNELFETSIVPIGDGITISVRREN